MSGGLVPCVVVGGGVVEFVPGDCVAPSGETEAFWVLFLLVFERIRDLS